MKTSPAAHAVIVKSPFSDPRVRAGRSGEMFTAETLELGDGCATSRRKSRRELTPQLFDKI